MFLRLKKIVCSEIGIRTPINRVRVCCPTIRRSPISPRRSFSEGGFHLAVVRRGGRRRTSLRRSLKRTVRPPRRTNGPLKYTIQFFYRQVYGVIAFKITSTLFSFRGTLLINNGGQYSISTFSKSG